jgi:hypothetical protein
MGFMGSETCHVLQWPVTLVTATPGSHVTAQDGAVTSDPAEPTRQSPWLTSTEFPALPRPSSPAAPMPGLVCVLGNWCHPERPPSFKGVNRPAVC